MIRNYARMGTICFIILLLFMHCQKQYCENDYFYLTIKFKTNEHIKPGVKVWEKKYTNNRRIIGIVEAAGTSDSTVYARVGFIHHELFRVGCKFTLEFSSLGPFILCDNPKKGQQIKPSSEIEGIVPEGWVKL
jgi:hypothetical protein